MKPEDAAVPDDPFTNLLARYDEALAAGEPESAGSLPRVQPELRERLLRAERCLARLERAWPRGRCAPDGASRAALSFDPATGSGQLGRFRLVRELGRGGTGVVFLAQDPSLRREVALKVPRPEVLVNPALRRRFLREAQAAAGLDHPSIVPVYETGDAGVACYIATAYCEGPTLASWLQQRSADVPPRVAAALMACLVRAVRHAHERGILHRDLKPGNVLLDTRTGEASGHGVFLEFTPKLTDFGLAKLLEPYEALGEDATRTGMILGTPRYMAPEQADGRARDVGPATDVWALGVILYEVLTRRPPFAGETDLHTMRLVRLQEPIPPSQLRPDTPRDLEAIVLKCLEKESHRRYATAALLGQDIERFLDGVPVRARHAGLGGQVLKWARRHPAGAALVAVTVAAALALGTGGAVYHIQLEGALAEVRWQHAQAVAREGELRRRGYATDLKLAHLAYLNTDLTRVQELLARHRPASAEGDLRGFEWYYLQGLLRTEQRTWRAHASDAYASAFSPNNRLLATCGKDGTVRLWEAATGRERATLRGHAGEVNGLAWTSDGSLLASASDDGTVRLWDLATGRDRTVLRGHQGFVYAVAFAPDDRMLASAGQDGVARLWDTATGREVGVLRDHALPIQALAFTPDGKRLATASEDRTVRVWDLPDGATFRDLVGHTDTVLCVAFSPCGRYLAGGGEDRSIWLWDLQAANPQMQLLGHTNWVQAIAFTPDGRTLVSGGKEGTVRFWDPIRGKLRHVLPAHADRLWSVAVAPDGQTLATTGADGTVRLWDGQRPPDRMPLPVQPSQAECVAFARDGQLLAIGLNDGTILLWDSATGQVRGVLRGHSSLVRGLAFTPDGANLVSTGSDGTARLWDVEATALRRSCTGHAGPVVGVALMPGGRRLVTASLDGTVRIWDLATGEAQAVLRTDGAQTSAVALSPDGRTLATHANTLQLWDLATGTPRCSLPGHRAVITALAFSPDGQLLASAGADHTVRLWDVGAGTERAVLLGHQDRVASVVFSPDGRTLASAAHDRTIRLWHVNTGQELATLGGHAGRIHGLAFARSGRLLASAGALADGQGEVLLWMAPAPGPPVSPVDGR